MADSLTSNSLAPEPLQPLSPATPSTPAAAPTLDSRVHLPEDAPAALTDADASSGQEEEKNRAEEALQKDGLDKSQTAMAGEGYPPGVNPGTEASSLQEEVGAEAAASSAPARKERKKNERGAAHDARKERKSAALAALRTPAAPAAAPSPAPSLPSLAGNAGPPTAAADGSTASSDAPAPTEGPPSPIASVDPVAQAKPAAHTPAPSAPTPAPSVPTPAPAASFAAAVASTASAAPTAHAALAKGQTMRLGGSLPSKRPHSGTRSTAPVQARAAKGASSPGGKVGGARGAKKRTGEMKPQVWVPDGRVVGNQSFKPNRVARWHDDAGDT
ncbi:hypothetical protein JCM10450v2_003460 [Rhodotorula kratochvilovae]